MTMWHVAGSPGLLFVHLPKTAGTWISGVMERHGGASWENIPNRGSHAGISTLSEDQIGGRLVAGCVREPVNWYLSFYHYAMQEDGTPGPYLQPWVRPGMSVEDAILGMVDPKGADLDLDWRPVSFMVPAAVKHPIRRDCAEGGYGLLTWLMLRAYWPEEVWTPGATIRAGDCLLDMAIDSACPREGLRAALEMAGVEIAPTLAAAIDEDPPANARGMREGTARWWSGNPSDYLSWGARRTIRGLDASPLHMWAQAARSSGAVRLAR